MHYSVSTLIYSFDFSVISCDGSFSLAVFMSNIDIKPVVVIPVIPSDVYVGVVSCFLLGILYLGWKVINQRNQASTIELTACLVNQSTDIITSFNTFYNVIFDSAQPSGEALRFLFHHDIGIYYTEEYIRVNGIIFFALKPIPTLFMPTTSVIWVRNQGNIARAMNVLTTRAPNLAHWSYLESQYGYNIYTGWHSVDRKRLCPYQVNERTGSVNDITVCCPNVIARLDIRPVV